jgi:primosomal protein N' (replication factor Y)
VEDAKFARVLVDVPLRGIGESFHYCVPAEMTGSIRQGSRILVPFGKKQVVGYVLDFSSPPGEIKEIKDISGILNQGPVFTTEQLELGRWMAEYYLCSVVSALQAVILPGIQGRGARTVKCYYPVLPPEGKPLFSRSLKQEMVWEAALAMPGLSKKELALAAGTGPGVIDSLVAKGLLRTEAQEVRRDPYPLAGGLRESVCLLSQEQSSALEETACALAGTAPKVFLLHGITGSGKTEVYLRAIEKNLAIGRQAVVMVPEIALTPQMVSIFKNRFGDRVAVLHSRLSEGERYDEWNRVRCGLAPVVLGARSAVFAPLNNPGLIVLDEEHEPSYKQEDTSPRYHARDVALKLAANNGAVVMLGSATPSLESYSRALPGGPYVLLNMTSRIGSRPLPAVRIVDMRGEGQSGNAGIFSRELFEGVRDRLDKGEQIILFLNRRGYSTYVVCRDCGQVMKCPHCDISLTYHASGHLRCHYCNHVLAALGACPECGSRHVGYFGTGTQKVEEEIRMFFPGAGVLRMDGDTTSRKGSHGEILRAFRDREADILLGTQMVAKGLDLPGVTLVGVINADTSLHMPDFRAAERTFQLITQVAGRAGRGDLGGEVLVQTFSPEHYSIRCAAGHDYNEFFKLEMKMRKTMQYPPFVRLARILITGTDEDQVSAYAGKICEMVEKEASGGRVRYMGPAPAPLAKVRDRFRYHIILKGQGGTALRRALANIYNSAGFRPNRKISLVLDIDPQNLM